MLDILMYIVFFSIGMVVGTIIHILVIRFYEEKLYEDELNKEFDRENLNEQIIYQQRKIAFENNIGKQLDINKLKNDKEQNQVLQEVKRRDLIQNINKYKQILRGE